MLWWSRRAARTDQTRAAALLWGGWVLVTGAVFSYMAGIIHPYYMVALAPGIAALVGIGAMAAWRAQLGPRNIAGRAVAAVAVVGTAVWSYVLLDRTPGWLPWLRWLVLVAGVACGVVVLASPWLTGLAGRRRGRLALALVPAVLALVAGLAGPAAYALDTINTAHTGAIPSAGPQEDAFGGPGGFAGRPGGFAGRGFADGAFPGGGFPRGGFPGGQAGQFGGTGGSTGQAGKGTFPGRAGGFGGGPAAGFGGAGRRGGPDGGVGGGFGGGLGGGTQVSSALVKLLEQDASGYTWVAATEGSTAAAPIELATGDAVMAIGGFNGTDPWPTLAAFEKLVAEHKVHYYVGQGSESFGGGNGSSAIASWVAAHFTSQTVGGQTVYNLTKPKS